MNLKKILFVLIFNFALLQPTLIFSFASVSHTEGSWLDNQDGYSSVEVFVPQPLTKNGDFVTFLDFRGHFFNHGQIAANGGLAFRYSNEDKTKIFGANVFYDYRQVQSRHNYHQVGVGLEYLTDHFDFRLNGYFPVSRSLVISDSVTFNYPGGYRATARNFRTSYTGFDAEVGSMIKASFLSKQRLYAAFGYYYYAPTRGFRNDYGFKARLETKLSKYITFEFKGGFDNLYRGMAQGTLSASIPLEKLFNCGKQEKAICQNSLLYQPIERQDIIALTEKQCDWQWNWNSPSVHCNCN